MLAVIVMRVYIVAGHFHLVTMDFAQSSITRHFRIFLRLWIRPVHAANRLTNEMQLNCHATKSFEWAIIKMWSMHRNSIK